MVKTDIPTVFRPAGEVIMGDISRYLPRSLLKWSEDIFLVRLLKFRRSDYVRAPALLASIISEVIRGGISHLLPNPRVK